MTADRLTSLLRPQRWRWHWSSAPALATRKPLGGRREGDPMATALVNSPVYAEVRQALTS